MLHLKHHLLLPLPRPQAQTPLLKKHPLRKVPINKIVLHQTLKILLLLKTQAKDLLNSNNKEAAQVDPQIVMNGHILRRSMAS